jgi:uncharacterized phiE125 gp8 family phage protein
LARYGLSLITAPTVEPILLDEAKVQCGVAADVSYHDDALRMSIEAARQKVEADTGRALISQTWDLSLDCFPTGLDAIYIPKAPVSAITHIKYYDTSNVEQTLATTYYKTLLTREPAEIRLKYQQAWPFIYSEAAVVTVRFVAGYGASYQSVPDGLRRAMLLLISTWFENPSATITGTIQTEAEFAYKALVANYTVGDEFHCYAR